MAIPSRQIGWKTEDNLLWQISKQLEQLTNVTANANNSTTTSTTTIATYKVYTALLTQSGGDDPNSISGGDAIIGRTYTIGNNGGASGDWINIGAPNNNVGTSFIATGTTPAEWGDGYLAYNTGAPVATVLENTIGNVWFTYNSIGMYRVNSDGLFTENKTYLSNKSVIQDDYNILLGSSYNDISSIFYFTWDGGIVGDAYLNQTPIEIRVYN